MFGRLFGKPKETPNTRDALEKLSEVRELLEKKENVLQKKIAIEVEKAKEYSRMKNKRAAIQCLKKKKLYEAQIENLANYQFRLQDQEVMMEGASATVEVVGAMRGSAQVLKNVQKQMNIDDVDKAMDEINEQAENMKMIQDALAQPISGNEFDEDELLEELEDLEALELDEQLLQPVQSSEPPSKSATDVTTMPSVPTTVPVARKTAAQKQQEEEDRELELLKQEMAL